MINKDNFNTARLILSLIVVFAHIRDLTEIQVIYNYTSFLNSDYAIKSFFAISGFLVFKSYLLTKNFNNFSLKRLYRIYPAYVVTIIFCIYIGFICSTLDFNSFIFSKVTLKYILSNLLFLNFLEPTLPLSLIGNPHTALNGSLWTIKIEILFYLFTPFLIYFYRKIGASVYIISIIGMSSLWVIHFTNYNATPDAIILSRQLPAQIPYYAFGGLIYLNKFLYRNIKYFAISSCIILFLFDSQLITLVFKPIFYSTLIIYLCTGIQLPFQNIIKIDFSYGIYLFHFPIIQYLIYNRYFEINIILSVTMAVIFSFIASFICWYFVERRFHTKKS